MKRLIVATVMLFVSVLLFIHYTDAAQASSEPEPVSTLKSIDWSADFEDASGEFSMGTISRSTDNPQSGDYFVRYTKVAGELNDPYADYLFGDHQNAKSKIDTPVNELYVQFYYRVSEGYKPPQGGHQKVFLINSVEESTKRGSNPSTGYNRRFQVYLELNENNQLYLQHSYIDEWKFFGLPQNMNDAAVSMRANQWEKIKVYVKQNTPGSTDGIMRMWINDVLKAEYTGLNLRHNTNYGMNKLVMSSYQGVPAETSGNLDFDNIKLSRTDITN